MKETAQTKIREALACRMEAMVSASMFGETATATTAHTGEALTIETMLDAMEWVKELRVPPMPRIVESWLMVEDGEPHEVPRTWKERIFTRPWRPLKATRTVVPKVPRKDAIQFPDGTLVMHPEMAAKLRASIGR